jgi:hypothetical protein
VAKKKFKPKELFFIFEKTPKNGKQIAKLLKTIKLNETLMPI